MKQTNRLLASCGLLLAAASLAGCATPARRIHSHPQIYAQATPTQQALISKGEIALGFTPEFVRLALGKPNRVTQRTDEKGTETLWHYADYQNNVVVTGGFGWPFYDPFFSPTIIVPSSATNDRVRVTFRNGVVVAVNRVVHE